MDFDPVLLARLQFAFTIIFHIIFPSFTIGLSAYIATLWCAVAAHRQRSLSTSRAVLDQDFRSLVCDGRRVRHRAVLPVRHQLEPLLGRRRQRGRAVDRLRGADRVFPRGDLSRRPAVRLESRAALAATCSRPRSSPSAPRFRHSGSSPPTAGCRRRPATKCATASPIRSTGSPSSSIRASRIASRTCSPPPISRPRFVVLAVGARYLVAGRHIEEGRTMLRMAIGMTAILAPLQLFIGDQHGLNTLKHQPIKIAAMEAHWDGSEARRLPHFRLARRKGRDQPLRDLHPARRVADPHARLERPVSRA